MRSPGTPAGSGNWGQQHEGQVCPILVRPDGPPGEAGLSFLFREMGTSPTSLEYWSRMVLRA